jgi:hypothetical protein
MWTGEREVDSLPTQRFHSSGNAHTYGPLCRHSCENFGGEVADIYLCRLETNVHFTDKHLGAAFHHVRQFPFDLQEPFLPQGPG